jgi:hypothetical protein
MEYGGDIFVDSAKGGSIFGGDGNFSGWGQSLESAVCTALNISIVIVLVFIVFWLLTMAIGSVAVMFNSQSEHLPGIGQHIMNAKKKINAMRGKISGMSRPSLPKHVVPAGSINLVPSGPFDGDNDADGADGTDADGLLKMGRPSLGGMTDDSTPAAQSIPDNSDDPTSGNPDA